MRRVQQLFEFPGANIGRVLAQQVVTAADRAKLPVTEVAEPHDDPATFDDFSKKLAMKRPDAILYTGLGDRNAGPCPGRVISAFTRVFDALWRDPGSSTKLIKLTICCP